MYVEVREVGFAVAACANSRLDLPTRASMPALANEVSAECYFYKGKGNPRIPRHVATMYMPAS